MGSDHLPIEIATDAQPHRNIHINPIRYKFNQTDREVFESTLEAALSSGDIPKLKSTQDIDKYADFIINAISTAVDKAIPTSKSGRPESQPISEETLALIKEISEETLALVKESTDDHLFRLSQPVMESFNREEHVVAAFLDIEKAFDNIWHNGFRYKIFMLDLPTKMTRWLSDFLVGRIIQVNANDFLSDKISPLAGVPRGSVLSRLLFLIYVND